MNARPFEFKYVAKFTPHSTEQPVSIVGQRTLLLEGIDLARNPITGYPNLDVKLWKFAIGFARLRACFSRSCWTR